MIIQWKSAVAGLFMGFMLASTAMGFAQSSMEGTYVGLFRGYGFNNDGKKYKFTADTTLIVESDNSFNIVIDAGEYEGKLIEKKKIGALYGRRVESYLNDNLNVRCKLRTGKSISGSVYWATPINFQDGKFKLTRVNEK